MSICLCVLFYILIFPLHIRTTSPNNIRLIEEDLKSKTTTDIIPFLKALLARMLLVQKGNVLGEETEFHKQLIKERDEIFKDMLGAAVSFCNKKGGGNWEKLEKNLKI